MIIIFLFLFFAHLTVIPSEITEKITELTIPEKLQPTDETLSLTIRDTPLVLNLTVSSEKEGYKIEIPSESNETSVDTIKLKDTVGFVKNLKVENQIKTGKFAILDVSELPSLSQLILINFFSTENNVQENEQGTPILIAPNKSFKIIFSKTTSTILTKKSTAGLFNGASFTYQISSPLSSPIISRRVLIGGTIGITAIILSLLVLRKHKPHLFKISFK